MLATNDVGDSVLSKETEAVTTLQDGEGLGTLNEPGRKQRQTRKYVNIIEEGSTSMISLFPHCTPFFSCCFSSPSAWRASGDACSKTNNHYLSPGAVEGILNFTHIHAWYTQTHTMKPECRLITYTANETPSKLTVCSEFMGALVFLCIWMQLSLFPEPGRVRGQRWHIGEWQEGRVRQMD